MTEGTPIPSAAAYLDAVFAEGGYLSKAFPGYRPRPGQVALSRAVDKAIAEGSHLFAEAPTATGKSVAYSVPASYYAATEKKVVVICTANIALQEQIVNKDLPLLQKILPWDFSFALMKGRHHYLCLDRYTETKNRAASQTEMYAAPAEERRHLQMVDAWAAASAEAGWEHESGDVSELDVEPMNVVWRKYAVTSDECKRGRCKFKAKCFSNAAHRKAKQALVVVTNYHMLFAHLQAYFESEMDMILPPFETLILDEAHKSPDIARDAFGFKFTPESIRRFVKKIQKMPDTDGSVADSLEKSTSWFFQAMSDLKRDKQRYKARLMLGNLRESDQAAWHALDASLKRGFDLYTARRGVLTERCEKAKSAGVSKDQLDNMMDELGDIELDHDRLHKLIVGLRAALEPNAESARHAFFLEEDEKGRTAICSKLIHSSDVLSKLFTKTARSLNKETEEIDERGPVCVVATSATLADANGFDFARFEFGAAAPHEKKPWSVEELVAESPFDWGAQCLFICPDTMPPPDFSPEYRAAVAKHIERTIMLAGGRTLGLFTSRKSLDVTYDALLPVCQRQGITLLRQGDAPRTKLVERFRADVKSCLFGLESFWAGVDVPGEALSVVVIDRLPFPTPDDPVMDALSEKDSKWFFHFAVPRSIIAFKQGFGRLIRSLGCYGAVVCLDRRLLDKSYGKLFLKSLPAAVGKTMRLDALADWLAQAPTYIPPPPATPRNDVPTNEDWFETPPGETCALDRVIAKYKARGMKVTHEAHPMMIAAIAADVRAETPKEDRYKVIETDRLPDDDFEAYQKLVAERQFAIQEAPTKPSEVALPLVAWDSLEPDSDPKPAVAWDEL